ncbi:MAG TPA: TorF family putative porin [Agitococcus sp.]|uniref:TorF family putative porin n=1 Tax=uncultured Agitococcus sp. TaxID=1506599 RepID=UPI002636BB72|nr:TorF family putative porin [uncultured Agitococcus sp.]HMU87978.1 TorF family putative porin [Agitococcus sp.]HMX99066.1 TorF family putative porin [Agitococcus sp.]HMY27840.1 TorF family putative porin [Agitococcus sp.]HMY81791.1 TorF family putative porin [Agitococcus sp.]HNA20198.1 TorF family putative porin [Agitococcus sp.]
MKLSSLAKALLASSMLFSAVNASAADPITVSGSAAFTSDYLFRGVSQTSNNAAVQGAMTFTHESGAYFSMWGSSIASGVGGLELDTLLGYSGKAGEVAYDVGVMRYNYPGLNDNNAAFEADYNEVYASVSTMGAKVGFNYSPDYFFESDKFLYLYASYGTEVAGVGLFGSVGMNKFDSAAMMSQALGTTGSDDSYIDYKLAASKAISGITVEGAYIGSNIDEKECGAGLCEGRFVLTLTKGF